MNIIFYSQDLRERSVGGNGSFSLIPNNWDDFTFKTLFVAIFVDRKGERHELGSLKIGYVGQEAGWTRDRLDKIFTSLPEGWFSLGQDADYYRALMGLDEADRHTILSALKDVVADEQLLNSIKGEKVFEKSLTRDLSLSVINGQYRRVLAGSAALTDFRFRYVDAGDDRRAPIDLDFRVKVESKPSTNIHVLIGRNGVGKTTLLNGMVKAITSPKDQRGPGKFIDFTPFKSALPDDYFSGLVSVSFSAFDPFVPPKDQPNLEEGVTYFYIGLKSDRQGENSDLIGDGPAALLTSDELVSNFVDSFRSCMSQPSKTKRWLRAIERLTSDDNFADMDLHLLAELDEVRAVEKARDLAERMSSGHSIVLLTITKLVEVIGEKTLVLLDEPESHLHPPLLSAFTRALADLLHDRNGVAIIATHSPVVLQEVPRSCVWKLTRLRAAGRADRPERETFGENVGVLTREVFGLEVAKSGFHHLLEQDVNAGGTFETILTSYNGQLGTEAQGILHSLIAARNLVERGAQ